jgi:hypothetical protein
MAAWPCPELLSMPVSALLQRLPLGAAALLAACALAPSEPPEPPGAPRPETVWAVTDAAELVRFNAGQPGRLQARVPLRGLAAGERLAQGSIEGVAPVVSPNTGTLAVVGALGTGALDDAAFDIADIGNTALAALQQGGRTRLHRIDLASGRATLLGTVGEGRALWGMAIEP